MGGRAMSRTRLIVALAFVMASVTLPAQAATEVPATIQDNFFNPNPVPIASGDTVRWTHLGAGLHSITADNGSFDSSPTGFLMANGETFSVTIGGPARTIRFHCKNHGAPGGIGMSGTITVGGTAFRQKPPADFDGNTTTDISVFRPSTGQWFVNGQATVSFGANGDVPVPGDYDGNSSADKAVFRPAVGGWYRNGAATTFLGLNGDTPVPGDYDGNGSADIAVFRPSVGGWYRNGSTTFFGLSGDIPVPGDYDGSATTDIAIFRPSVGGWYRSGGPTMFFGLNGDIPVPGDYDGDGLTDLAVFRPSTGQWFVQGQTGAFLGVSGDLPLPLPAAIRAAAFP
jgi:plastocyanin